MNFWEGALSATLKRPCGSGKRGVDVVPLSETSRELDRNMRWCRLSVKERRQRAALCLQCSVYTFTRGSSRRFSSSSFSPLPRCGGRVSLRTRRKCSPS